MSRDSQGHVWSGAARRQTAVYLALELCCCAAGTSLTPIAVTRLGKVVIHKAKRNANLSFSKGKTWNLEDMRAVEVIGVSPTSTRIRLDSINARSR
jgi:hypothetical protein